MHCGVAFFFNRIALVWRGTFVFDSGRRCAGTLTGDPYLHLGPRRSAVASATASSHPARC